MMSIVSMWSNGRPSTDDGDECEATKTAISSYLEREEEIERKKMEVKERVKSQLNRAEEETRRLAQVWEELEVLTDPMRKEVGAVRKKIDLANRDLKPLAQICHKKEREYKEPMEAFKEKNNEKAQLTNTLVELVSQSEKIRMRKLEELSKIVSLNT
ncbi:reticulocyte-binding protein 2 homolog a-like [Salvia splendens]|uniref:reticulocyte-binding protein 2 homolog a-like n=1 Tax=Salvia splendens TaxID=180675 RepID=UPI001C25C136|nr:reticulocyte-binding protein 2 homolog a-like [Salvia splendens]